ncbi:MAG: TlpA family protein disulfide reductase [Bryobacterales bacterium]|nr:TlpA family protein disulfide reductase [Bryobacterales bacterium]
MKLARRIVPLAAALMLASLTLGASEVPREAGPLNFNTFKGQKASLAALKGKVVAVMFFSTDCPHCQHTAELLKPIYKEFHPKGFEILALAVNPSAAANLDEFAAKYGVEFPIGLGTNSQWTTFCQLPVMGQKYVPHLVFVDKKGVIQEDHPGADRAFWLDQEARIRAAIEKLLAQ